MVTRKSANMSEIITDAENDEQPELSDAEESPMDNFENTTEEEGENTRHSHITNDDDQDQMPTPMTIKQEPDIELPETENYNEFQNHFQIISVKSLHPLEHLMGNADEISTLSTDNADTTEDCSIKEMLQTASSSKGAFGIANFVDPAGHESDENSLLVEAKSAARKKGRPPSDNPKRRKSKLDIFRRKPNVRTKINPTGDTEDDDSRMSGMTMDDHEQSNDGESKSLAAAGDDGTFSFTSEIEQPPSTTTTSERSTRRKSAHKPYDIAMEIVDDAAVKKERLNLVRSIKNPHMDYIKKVAFLRVCVNYILDELALPKFNFSRILSFRYMREAYMKCQKK